MKVRMTARLTGQLVTPKVKHYRGLPSELTDGKDHRELMEWPLLLFIEETPEGVFLYRYNADGQVVGDTWHVTIEEAQQQARFEFGDLLSDWESVPGDVKDVVAKALGSGHR